MKASGCPISAEQGHSDHAAGLPRRIQHAGCHAGPGLLDTAKQGRGQRRHEQTEPAAHTDQLRTDRPIRRSRCSPQQRQARQRRQRCTERDGGARPDPLGQARRGQIDREHDTEHGHEGKPGRERRQVIDLLEIQAEHEDQAVDRDVGQQAHQRAQRKQAVAKQDQGQHRLQGACLLPDEGAACADRDGETQQDGAIGPAPCAGFDHGRCERPERSDRRSLPRPGRPSGRHGAASPAHRSSRAKVPQDQWAR